MIAKYPPIYRFMRKMLGKPALVCVMLAAVLSGCVQLTSIPGYARSGDTLVLGLGGIARNAQGNQYLSTADLQITLTDSQNVTYTLTPNKIFKAYPDYGSDMNYQTIGGAYVSTPVPIKPFDGGYFVTVALVGADGKPLPSLAPGSAVIKIASATGTLTNTLSAISGQKEGDLTQIPLEIIAGTANASTASKYNQQFSSYQGIGGTLQIAPQGLMGVTTVGGMQLAITYPTPIYRADAPPMVVPFNHHPYIQLAQNIVDNQNGTKTLNVLLTAQNGFVDPSAATYSAFTPSLSDLNLRLMYFVANGQTSTPLSDFQIITAKTSYIDINGNVISGATATLSAH